jgi:hypothetical protein
VTSAVGRLGLVVLVLLAVATSGCRRGGEEASGVVLDGRPRLPDVEGVVTDVSFTELTLEGGRTYRITRDLQCFSTYTLEPLPLLGRKGQYVQLGLDGSRVVWLASIGGVLTGDEPSVYYTGSLEREEDGRLYFRDGTVFRVGDGVQVPAPGFVQVEIDPATQRARRIF